jgi:hypothetical protein
VHAHTPTEPTLCAPLDACHHEGVTEEVRISALAVNIAVPEDLQWQDSRRGDQYVLTSVTVRLLPDGILAAKAYGRPVGGGRGGYTSFPLPDEPRLKALVEAGATVAAERWSTHRGLA